MQKIKTNIMKYFFWTIIFFFCFQFVLTQTQSGVSNNTDKTGIDTSVCYLVYQVDSEPQYPGGKDSLQEFFKNNLNYTSQQLEYNGIVSLCFQIDTRGNAINDFVPGEREKVLFGQTFRDLIHKMPKWKPGTIKGVNVRTEICLPFSIILK